MVTDAAFFLAPVNAAAAVALGWRRRNALLLFTGGAATTSAAIQPLANALLSVPFPVDRTGIYFLALVPLALAALTDSGTGNGSLQKVFAATFYGLGLGSLVLFAAELNINSFQVWEYDANTRQIAGRLAQLATGGQTNSVKVGAFWQLQLSLKVLPR